ncbi:MAG TPA: hypothetical protein VK446_06780 [Methylocystis sp.]|nr:hypothetical protein [Methylocystis sp.]
MRYVLAAIFVCALGLPAASALPTGGADPAYLSKATPIEQAAKRKGSRPQKHSRGTNGIHPLVGSGDY